jgi:Zn-dependent protease/CBS domain-containing protein
MGGIRLGQITGIEVRLDYSWFLIFFLLVWNLAVGVFPGLGFTGPVAWTLGFAGALLLFASVLVHEFSHALLARRYGIEVTEITLFLFGGVAQIRQEPPSPAAEFLIAGVGPVVSAAIGASCLTMSWLWKAAHLSPEVIALLGYLGVINLTLALFNLIPGLPLDGGRLLRSVLWGVTGNARKATRWASNSGRALALGLIIIGFYRLFRGDPGGVWLILIGWFMKSAAESTYQQLLLRRALAGVAVADVASPEPPGVDADLRVTDLVNHYLLRLDHPVYPVVRGRELVGLLSVEDVRRLDRDLWGVTAVHSVSRSPDPETLVASTMDAWEAFRQMVETDQAQLFVVSDGRLEGVVSRESLLRAVQRRLRFQLPAWKRTRGAT